MILITGSSGQLGRELSNLFDENGVIYHATSSSDLDITNESALKELLSEIQPEVIFNCAAFTAVDDAESVNKDKNWNVNVKGTENLVKIANEIKAVLVYVSTDYVFDGTSDVEYSVDDRPNPMNEYGKAKLSGELIVQEKCEKYYIVRTSWLFGEFGKNFVYTMKNLAKKKDKLFVVDDQVGRPTWTRTLSEFLLHLYRKKLDYGIYHLSNDGFCSWYEFACEILKNDEIEIAPVSSMEFKQEAYRPKHSVLNLEKAKTTGFHIITWQEALHRFTENIS